MKINEKILSIPPYISTPWANVKALRMDGPNLIVLLHEGGSVAIPGLSEDVILTAFEYHQKTMELKNNAAQGAQGLANPFMEGFGKQADQALRFGMVGMEALGNAIQHSFEMKDAPPLPQEILSKVEAVARVIAPEMKAELPKAEPHCNCPHCQIARAIQRGLGKEETQDEGEHVPIEELLFEEWHIEQTGFQLYSVTNKVDTNEKYSVFLGNPVGCTCGKQGCDHILAVLRS